MGSVVPKLRLSIAEFEMLEEGLKARRRDLAKMGEELKENVPAEAALLEVIEQDITAGDQLVGRLREMISLFAWVPAMILTMDHAA